MMTCQFVNWSMFRLVASIRSNFKFDAVYLKAKHENEWQIPSILQMIEWFLEVQDGFIEIDEQHRLYEHLSSVWIPWKGLFFGHEDIYRIFSVGSSLHVNSLFDGNQINIFSIQFNSKPFFPKAIFLMQISTQDSWDKTFWNSIQIEWEFTI